jgi:tRNA dimethylallyltransferase
LQSGDWPSGLEGLAEALRACSVLLIAGPTASGKSALAQRLARHNNGVIVNADSMQVYRDLAIVTARPTELEMTEVQHLLFGHVEGHCNYSVGLWLADVVPAIAAVRAAGQWPIVVGGTGLYFKALVSGLSAMPNVPHAVRERVRSAALGVSPPGLHARLADVDPATASLLRPSDPQRILRALEVYEATGMPLSRFQTGPRQPFVDNWVGLFLSPERADLNQRINGRFDRMLADGALEEVRRLQQAHYDPALPIMRAHGVPGLIAHLSGTLSLAEAIERGKADTRHYAKRQFTWARHQLPGFRWLSPQALADWLDRFEAGPHHLRK